ncbi:hypothetical protein ACD661_11545 [Legionella lytica]|uniref:Uncharacterized protein n=1 Tax=Legionella lytica TaxID=96232 RepID=A0ABW8DB34_9GAMM
MPFNIDLSIGKPFVKLQITKNTITLYFAGAEVEVLNSAIEAWGSLDRNFLGSIPGYNDDWFRGPDAPHIKRNHTHRGETDVDHFHLEFVTEVTPELLSLYLKKFWEQQSSHADVKFQFFRKGEVEHILEIFEIYYKEYKGSSVEALVEEHSRLTAEERESYDRALQAERAIEALKFLTMFTVPGRAKSTSMHASEENCLIM